MQEGMLNNLSRRASKAGIEKQLHLHRCSQSSLREFENSKLPFILTLQQICGGDENESFPGREK